jgi:hypothetical protein
MMALQGAGDATFRRVRNRRHLHPCRRSAGPGARDRQAPRHDRRLRRDSHPPRPPHSSCGRARSPIHTPTISSPSAAKPSLSRASRIAAIRTGWYVARCKFRVRRLTGSPSFCMRSAAPRQWRTLFDAGTRCTHIPAHGNGPRPWSQQRDWSRNRQTRA